MIQKIDHSAGLEGQALERFNKIVLDVQETTKITAEISSSMEEQAKGAEGLIKSTGSLLNMTEEIKATTIEQQKDNKMIYENLNNIQQNSGSIIEAIGHQVEKSQTITDEIGSINQVAKENLMVSKELSGLVECFNGNRQKKLAEKSEEQIVT